MKRIFIFACATLSLLAPMAAMAVVVLMDRNDVPTAAVPMTGGDFALVQTIADPPDIIVVAVVADPVVDVPRTDLQQTGQIEPAPGGAHLITVTSDATAIGVLFGSAVLSGSGVPAPVSFV